MRIVFVFICVTALFSRAFAQVNPGSPQPAPIRMVERELWIPAPQSFPNGLDALEVYADRPGKHPLVILTHGTSSDQKVRMQLTPWAQADQARWFARRGYFAIVIIRRGYGRSGGQQDGQFGGCRSDRRGSFDETGRASADDIRAAIKFAAGLPEVDTETVVSAGVSTGGFAQAALSADPPKGLKAAISFAGGRGGDGHENNCNLEGLVDAFGAYGKGAHKHGPVPMLWIYSENDHWFPPMMARKFEAAYTKGGGTEEFVLEPPNGEDGHHLYGHVDAWSDTVQTFLKAHELLPLGDVVLPSPAVPDVPPPAGISGEGIEGWKRYLQGSPFKAFAANSTGEWGFAQARFNQDLADEDAMEHCKKAAADKGKSKCAIIARTPGAK